MAQSFNEWLRDMPRQLARGETPAPPPTTGAGGPTFAEIAGSVGGAGSALVAAGGAAAVGGAAAGSAALATVGTAAAAAGAAIVAATGVGAAVVGLGVAVGALLAAIDGSGSDETLRRLYAAMGGELPPTHHTIRDAFGKRRIHLGRSNFDARLPWEGPGSFIPAAGREVVYAFRRMREEGLSRVEILRWLEAYLEANGGSGEARGRVMFQRVQAEQAEANALRVSRREPFPLGVARLLDAGVGHVRAIERALELNSAPPTASMARPGEFFDPGAWALRAAAIRARFPAPKKKGGTMLTMTQRPTYTMQPTGLRGEFRPVFAASGTPRALNPADASGTQLAVAAAGLVVGAALGWKVGKKRGKAKGFAAAGAVLGAAGGYFGAHAAGT